MTANPLPPAGPARVRVEGTVTAVHADGRFALALPDGTALTGTAAGSQLRRLGKLLTCEALVFGVASEDGTLAADGVMPPRGLLVLGKEDPDVSDSEQAELHRRLLAALAQKWPEPEPGEGTDEELDELLRNDR